MKHRCIACEIIAAQPAIAEDLAAIAKTCANDLDQSLQVSTRVSSFPQRHAFSGPIITLHLPAQFAASQHEVWCLASHLTCFLPDVRVTVLVHGAHAFASTITPAVEIASA